MKAIKSLKNGLSAKALYIVLLTLLPFTGNAQPDPGDEPDVPIDGGVSLLVAAGVAYGAKKLHDAKRKKEENNNTEK